ncbi:MAG: CoA transferase [Chloroflexi bacterium]|nr:CoA transferase [Chloroflexota bacterium]
MLEGMQEGSGPLAGVRVVDFTWALAGPGCTLFLGMLGAEVIKVETAQYPDAMRRGAYSVSGDLDSSPTFNSANLNKLGLRLNLRRPEGVQIIKRLVAVSDVVVENFRLGVMDRIGLGYQVLRQVNPTLVMASSCAFGSTGPWRELAGYANVFNAMSGMGSITGYQDGPPTELRDSIDMRVGTNLTFAVLAALYHRQRTGVGQYIDHAAAEAITRHLGDAVMDYAMNQRVTPRRGNRDPLMAPHGCYPCKENDTWLSLAVGTDDEWRALCLVLGRPDLAADPRFADGAARWAQQAELDSIIGAWTCQRDARQAMQELQEAGVAAIPSFSAKDLFEDPHLRARGVWQDVEHPKLGTTHVQVPPWRLSATPASVRRHGPLLGGDNDYVLCQVLGMGAGEVERLAGQQVFE